MTKKFLAIFVALAMMFVFVGMANAAEITKAPVDIYYAYPSYDGASYAAFPGGVDGTLTIIDGADTVHMPYTITYVDGYFDDTWSAPSDAFSTAAANNFLGYEWIWVDMTNMYNGQFGTGYAAANTAGANLGSIRTADYSGNYFMPIFFSIRDTLGLTQLSTNYDAVFATAFFDLYAEIGGDWGTADPDQTQAFIELLVLESNGY